MSDAKSVQAQSFVFNVDDVPYALSMPLTIAQSMRMRRELGWSQPQLIEELKSPDLDVMAVCVWLSRVQSGEDVAFETVAASVTYESKLSIGLVEDDHPEL